MKRPTYAICLLAAVVLVAACSPMERRSSGGKSVTVSRSWPASEVREIRVSEVNGSVSVEAVATDVISLVATVRGDLDRRKGTENEGLFETTQDGESLRIGRRDRGRRNRSWNIPFLFGSDRRQIDYVLQVPPSTSLRLRTVNGRITTRGVDGPADIVTVNGPLDIEISGNNELNAKTVNGRVRATFNESFQGAQFKTVNGRVKATLPASASFAVDLSQVNGDFEASFPLSIRSSPGSRRVSGDVNGGQHRLRIVTVNGDVELARLPDSR
jgi:hypothetical protein